MGWLGWPQTAVTQALAPFIVVVGICNAIHLVARYACEVEQARGAPGRAPRGRDARGGARHRRLLPDRLGHHRRRLRILRGQPGALSFLHFGVIAAFGVMAALDRSASRCCRCAWCGFRSAPRPSRRASLAWRRALELVVDGAQRRSLAGARRDARAVRGSPAVGLARLRVEVDVYHLFGEQTRVVRWIRFVEEHLRKPDTLDVVLTLPEGQADRGSGGARPRRAALERARRAAGARRGALGARPAALARTACCTRTIPPSKSPPRPPPATPSCLRGSRGTTRSPRIAG